MNVDALFTGNTVAAFGTNELRPTVGEDSMSQVESEQRAAYEFSSKTVTAAKANTTHGRKSSGDCTEGISFMGASMSSTSDRDNYFAYESNFLRTEKRLDTYLKPLSISDDKVNLSHNYLIIDQKENIENNAIYDDLRCRSNNFEDSEHDLIENHLPPKTDENDKDQKIMNCSSNIFTTVRKLSIHSPQNIFSTGTKYERMPIGNSWGTFDFSHGTGGSDSWGGENSRCGFQGEIPLSGLKNSNISLNLDENDEKSLKNNFCCMKLMDANYVANSYSGMKTVKKRNCHRSDTKKNRKRQREKQESSVRDRIGSTKKIDNLEKKRGRSDDNVEGRDYSEETENKMENNGHYSQSIQFLKENDQSNFSLGNFHSLNNNFMNILTDDNTNIDKICDNEDNMRNQKYNDDTKIKSTMKKNNYYSHNKVFDNNDNYKKDFIDNKNTTFAPRKSLQRNLRSILEESSPIHYNEFNFSDSNRRILKGFSDTNKKRQNSNFRMYVLTMAIHEIFCHTNHFLFYLILFNFC